MSYGFQATNTASRVQIDQDYRNARQIQSGTLAAGSHQIALPYPVNSEPALIMLRPHAFGYYIGAMGLWDTTDISPNGVLEVGSQISFDYAICSATQGSAATDSDDWGLQVFSASGTEVVYDSRQKHPNITQFLFKPADSTTSGGYPNTYAISGFSEMPWLLGNPLMVTPAGVGEFSESMGSVMACVNSLTSVTIDFRDAATAAYGPFPNLSDRSNYNPYHGIPGWFAVGKLT